MEQIYNADSRNQEAGQNRPVFLTVLCILSFVGNGLVILGSLFTLVWWNFFQSVKEYVLENGQFPDGTEFPLAGFYSRFLSLLDYVPLITIVTFVAAVINLLGVVMMWKLKRAGYYVYLVTELAPVITNLVIYTMVLGAMGFGMSMFNLLIPVGFVIMYGLNLKHMK